MNCVTIATQKVPVSFQETRPDRTRRNQTQKTGDNSKTAARKRGERLLDYVEPRQLRYRIPGPPYIQINVMQALSNGEVFAFGLFDGNAVGSVWSQDNRKSFGSPEITALGGPLSGSGVGR